MPLAVQGQPVDELGQLGPNVIGPGYLQGGYNAPVYYDSGYSGGYSSGGGGGGGGGGGASPSIDTAAIAGYDQSIGNINAGINRLGDTLNSGYSEIDASYQNALNQLNAAKNQANATYDTNKKTTAQDYVGSKNTIGANAGNTLTGLQRLLGSRGAGGGSAATISAPQAVTRQATLQRADVGNTFGKNNQALDTEWNNYITGYNNQVSSATNQRDQQRGSLERQIANNRASLLQQLATLQGQRAAAAGGNPVGASQPYLDQANAALNAAASYHVDPIAYQTAAYNAPTLGAYTVNPNAAPTYNGQTSTSDYFSPYLQALLGKKQDNTLGATVTA